MTFYHVEPDITALDLTQRNKNRWHTVNPLLSAHPLLSAPSNNPPSPCKEKV